MVKKNKEDLQNEETKVLEEVCESVKVEMEEALCEEFKERHELDEEEVEGLINGLLADSREDDGLEELNNEAVEKNKFELAVFSQKLKGLFVVIGSLIGRIFSFVLKKLMNTSKSERIQEIIGRLKVLPKSHEGRLQIGKLMLGVISTVIVVNLALSRPHIQGFDASSLGVYDTADNRMVERITASREEITKKNLIRFFDTWIQSSAADMFIIDLNDGFGLIFEDTTSGHFQYNQVQVVAFEEVVDNLLLTGYDTIWMTENPYTEARIENGDIIYDGIELFQ